MWLFYYACLDNWREHIVEQGYLTGVDFFKMWIITNGSVISGT